MFVFQVGLEKMATEHTQLIYMTTGVLLQKLVQSKCLTEFSHIFVDEVHKHEANFLMYFFLHFILKYNVFLSISIIICLFNQSLTT